MGCRMYWTVLFVIGSNHAVATDVLDSSYLPWRTVLEGQPYTNETLCELPEYPERGGYVVIGEPDAQPGGIFEEVSLVQYITAADGRSIDTNLLRCSHGKWSETVVQYTTEKLYFNTSWCPLLCSSSDINSRVPAPTGGNLTGTYNAIKRNMNVKKMCILPPYPDRGTYQVIDNPSARPGDAFERVKLHQYTFDGLKGLYEFKVLACASGTWYTKQLQQHSDEVVFLKSRCPVLCSEPLKKPFTTSVRISEDANKKTSCKLPPYPRDGNYTAVNRPEVAPGDDLDAVRLSYSCHSNRMLVGSKDAYCIEGVWSNEAPKCIRCGLIKAPVLEQMSAEEKVRYELPWHVAVYDKSHSNEHICSGSLVAANLILTGAHCFWSDAESQLPASRFFVAAGKIYGDWNSSLDNHTQTSEVVEIILHPKFRGAQANNTNDIALLFLDPPLNYTDYVGTVCLNFDGELDEKQSKDVKIGKIGSWSSPSEDTRGASKLKVDWTRYVDIGKCISESTSNFRQYVTSDKICAENVEGPTLCEVNGGGGLTYHVWADDGARVNYLRGIASTAPADEGECNVHPIGVYTHVLHHEDFLKRHLKRAMWI